MGKMLWKLLRNPFTWLFVALIIIFGIFIYIDQTGVGGL